MDSGSVMNGTPHTNHDRQPVQNGVNGANGVVQADKGKGKESMANGAPGAVSKPAELPEGIQHITEGFFPLGHIIKRQAQRTLHELGDTIDQLAKMPISGASTNGNAKDVDDTSEENIAKKMTWIEFARRNHDNWIKVAVITEWSKRAKDVGKLIDLNNHLMGERWAYDAALDHIIQIRRGLPQARVPTPDLKTAHYALTTGRAPWMPEVRVFH